MYTRSRTCPSELEIPRKKQSGEQVFSVAEGRHQPIVGIKAEAVVIVVVVAFRSFARAFRGHNVSGVNLVHVIVTRQLLQLFVRHEKQDIPRSDTHV